MAENSGTTYRSTVPAGRLGFGRLLLAEYTKLRSVPRWRLTLVVAALLTVTAGMLIAAGYRVNDDDDAAAYPPTAQFRDEGHFVYQTLNGDGQVTARVTHQDRSHPWAKAGLMVRADEEPGATYAAVVATPGHGVRLRSGFGTVTDTAAAGDPVSAPVWLRLSRSGTRITAHESADGRDWQRVGTLDLPDLEGAAQVGMVVASPDEVEVERHFSGEAILAEGTLGRATFDSVRLDGATGGDGGWRERERSQGSGEVAETDGSFTVSGSGDVGRFDYADDPTQGVLSASLLGVVALVALAVVSVTSEYRLGTIRTSFAAHPRRARVLLAKALVVGGAAFATGLVAALGTVLATDPVLRSNGLAPLPLGDPAVVRAVIGTATLMAGAAVFGLGVAAVLRRTAFAVAAVLLLTLVPQVAATGFPLPVATWLERLTPAAGFAVQQTVQRYDTAIGPWSGLGVMLAYAVLTLAVAMWLAERRDP